MLKSWNYIVNNDSRLQEMMSNSLSIYDQALYFQRQKYFETKEQGKIKTYSYNELWNIYKESEIHKQTKLDINIKQYIVRQVCVSWLSFIKSNMEFKKNPSKFLGKPKMPNYLYKKKDWNIVQVDKTRFRKINEEQNSFNLPCSDYTIKVPKQIRIKDIRQVTIQKYFGKIKINIIYEDREVLRNEYDLNSAIGIDLGINNLCAITSNDKSFSYIINGRPLKSINQFYNKRLAELKSQLEKCNKRKSSSKAIQKLTLKRNNKIDHYLHCCSRQIIDLCIKNKIEKIIIGYNNGWKQEVNLGKKTNQNFVQIPFNQLITQIQYKSQKYTDLEVIVNEESYTSKIDHLALEELKKQENYLGKRIKRGLFKSSTGKIVNADINGAIGILRKGNAISDVQLIDLRNRGDVVSPKQFILNV